MKQGKLALAAINLESSEIIVVDIPFDKSTVRI